MNSTLFDQADTTIMKWRIVGLGGRENTLCWFDSKGKEIQLFGCLGISVCGQSTGDWVQYFCQLPSCTASHTPQPSLDQLQRLILVAYCVRDTLSTAQRLQLQSLLAQVQRCTNHITQCLVSVQEVVLPLLYDLGHKEPALLTQANSIQLYIWTTAQNQEKP